MNKGKMYALAGMLVLGAAVFGVVNWHISRAQNGSSIKPLKIASITSVTSSNPRGNYVRADGTLYCDASKICNDNSGISVWTGSFPTPYTECGHFGLSGPNGEFLYNSTDSSNVRWEHRAACNGYVAIGASDRVQEQVLTISGTTQAGKVFTINVNVPQVLGDSLGNWKFYVDTNGATYHCRADHTTSPLRYPNDCDLTVEQAFQSQHLARAGNPAVANDGLCQAEESYATTPNDCPDTTPPVISSISAVTGGGSTTVSWVTNEASNSEVEHGSNSTSYSYVMTDTSFVTNHSVRLPVSIGYGITYYYRVNSKDVAGNQATSDQQSLTVPVPPIACTDSDGGSNSSVKGVSTGIYAGAAVGYHFIYGTGTTPTTPVATIEKSTIYDYCASPTQLNEGFCDASTGRMSMFGMPCSNGCSDGVCLSAPPTGDLLGHWRFDGNGSNAVVGGMTAVIVGNASFKTDGGKLGGYAYIPGSSDWLKIPYNRIFDLPNDFTISFWFRQRADRNFLQDFIYKGTAPNNYNFRIFRQLWNQYNFGPIITGYTSALTENWMQTSNPNQLAHNMWHHVVFTKDTRGRAYYLDGELIHADNSSSPTARQPATDIIIGDSAVDTDIDELKIWNRALDAAGARSEGGFPASTMPATPSGLVATIASNGTDVNLNWMDNSNNESGFRVYRRKTGVVEAELRGSTGPGITSYTDVSIPAGTYEYYVTSYIMSGGQLSQQSPTSNVPVVTISGTGTGTTTPGTTTLPGTTTPTGTSTSGTTTPPPPTGDITPRGCKIGEASCPKQSWCEGGGNRCFLSDSKITCVGSTTTAVGLIAGRCPAGTSVCEPYDPAREWTGNCLVPGQKIKSVPSSTSSKWCGAGSAYYSKTKNSDGSYDMVCLYSDETVPSGYGACRPEDKSCREKGDKWTAEEEKNTQYIYCMYGQKCNLSGGGGTCVGQNEVCPSGTLYCPTQIYQNQYQSKCGEPETFTDDPSSSFYCGAGNVVFYNKNLNKAYCSKKKPSGQPDYGMLTGAEIKTKLQQLGSGWQLCNPFFSSGSTYSSKCLEPGQTGSSNDWCAWSPPGYMPPTSGSRTCPVFDEVITITPPPPGTTTPPGPGTTTPPVTPPPPIEPPQPPVFRECRPGEFPSGINMCRVPEYRWNIGEKKWEKCLSNGIDTRNDSKTSYKSCQSMHFEIEEKWRTMRYLKHPPETDGEWYMPPWDASADMKEYNPRTDRFEECRKEIYRTTMVRPGEWVGSCSPVPKEDAEWLLEMNRAQYKLHQLYQQANPPGQPFPPNLPLPPIPVPEEPQITEDLPPALCKGYLRGLRNSLNGDKQFWKDVKRQAAVLPADHPDFEKIADLLAEAKKLILDMENFLRGGKCEKEKLLENQAAKDKLHTEIFAELSSYLSGIHDYVEVGFCQTNLAEKAKRINELAKKASDEESRKELSEFASEISEKLAEFKEKAGDFEYDAAFECREYMREVESEFSSLVRQNDRDVRRVVEEVLEKELGPVLLQLQQESEARKDRIDQLLVQVAELRKAADAVSGAVTDIKKSAEELSQKVAVSLKALAYIGEKFEEEKKEIEEAKGKLVPLVQRAIEILGDNRCLRRAMQTRMMTEFNTMTSVNWIDNQYEEIERRLNSFITACEARDVASKDIEIFIRAIEEAAERNQRASCERGLTPFCDVPTHEWYYGGMFTGHRTGFITQGRPGDNVLRQDALLMILRVKGLTDAELKGECEIPGTSSIINASPYARCAVSEGLKLGLVIRGDVSVPVSRGEIASWIAALELVPNITDERVKEIQESYQDLRRGVLPEWVASIAELVDAKVMVGQVGSEASIWQPFDKLTRASLAVVLEQLQRLRGNLPT